MTDQGEKCARCGEVGEDRRTLWAACFYDMNELGIPFEERRLLDMIEAIDAEKVKDPVKIKVGDKEIAIAPGQLKIKGVFEGRSFYTLRVCKDCRAAWLAMFARWFLDRAGDDELRRLAESKVKDGMHSIDEGIPIRVFGATVVVPKDDEKA